MTRQSSRRAYCAHSSRIFSFKLHGEKIDPNLISQNHEKKKEIEENHNLCLNSYGSSIRPCNNNRSRALSFELFGEKIDPNLINQCDERLEREDDEDRVEHRFPNGNIGNSLSRSSSMEILDACNNEPDFMDSGYLSDGAIPNRSNHYIHDRKKGLPWTRDEHKSFLIGLEKLGKGDWRGISKKYVQTRTPTQVASHAQKYFIRMQAREKGKRRSSLFDMTNESMRFGNNNNEHKASNPECSKMIPFGPNINIDGLYPFNDNWNLRTSQARFMPQPLTITDGSPWRGVVASRSKEDVLQTK